MNHDGTPNPKNSGFLNSQEMCDPEKITSPYLTGQALPKLVGGFNPFEKYHIYSEISRSTRNENRASKLLLDPKPKCSLRYAGVERHVKLAPVESTWIILCKRKSECTSMLEFKQQRLLLIQSRS